MAVITLNGFVGVTALQNPATLTPELSEFGPVNLSPPLTPAGQLRGNVAGALVDNLPISENEETITFSRMPTFFQDYYYRIHIRPVRIDLGVVAAQQSRVVSLWNAYPDTSAELDAITSSQTGIEYSGDDPPVSMPPLQLKTWDLVITTSGPPNINAEVLWDFSNVPDPAPIVVTGTRAIQFKYAPSATVKEKWAWMTDKQVAVDGTEQRAGLRGVPRQTMESSITLVSQAEIRDVEQMLFSAQNRLWVPFFQYATTVNELALAGTDFLKLDVQRADPRVNEYLMLVLATGTVLVQVATLAADGVWLAAPLAQTVPAGTLAAPGAPSFVTDSTAVRRYSVNEAAEMSINALSTQVKEQWARPGNTISLTTFDSMVVLDKRPLANSLVPQSYVANTQRFDADVGIVEIQTLWDYTKQIHAREYLLRRVQQPVDMDYWKVFGDTIRGSLKNFLLPTYRPDLELLLPMGIAANNATFKGSAYAEFFYKAPTHRRLAITTAGGVHYAKVTSAAKTVDGDSLVVFTPALPNDPLYTQTELVSILLAVRLEDDEFDLEHFPLETILSLNVRTADP